MKISVVIPLYNKALSIKRSVQSVLAQSYKNFELIVVDDGSTDDGGSIVNKYYDERIFLIRQNNSGVSAARNTGIKHASGNLVAFLDADDSWKPDFLKTIVRLSKNFPNAGLYATAYQINLSNQKIRNPMFSGISESPWEGIISNYFKSATFGDPPVCASAVAIPYDILIESGGFQLGKRMGEDLDLWGRIALKYPIAFSSQVQAIYHQDAENRACNYFIKGDEHPFVETINLLRKQKINSQFYCDDINLYVDKLILDNVRQYVLAKQDYKARVLASNLQTSNFYFRRLIWGSNINILTYFIWKIYYKFKNLVIKFS